MLLDWFIKNYLIIEKPLEKKLIREEIAKIGKTKFSFTYHFLQSFFSWLTGKPLTKFRKRDTVPDIYQLLFNIAILFFGVFLLSYIFTHKSWTLILLPIGYVLVTGAQRTTALVYLHAAIHNSFFSGVSRNKHFVNLVSILILSKPYECYRKTHINLHHSRKFAGNEDPDLQTLLYIGLIPGSNVADLWKTLLMSLFNPILHLKIFLLRIKSHFNKPVSSIHRYIFITFWLILISASIRLELFDYFLFCYFLPTIFGYQFASIISTVGEHRWLNQLNEKSTIPRTSARFLGSAPPSTPFKTSPLEWMIWSLKVIVVYIPARLCLVPGDMPAHDLHHAMPNSNWRNLLYERNRWLEETGHNSGITETWGLRASINNSLNSISNVTN